MQYRPSSQDPRRRTAARPTGGTQPRSARPGDSRYSQPPRRSAGQPSYGARQPRRDAGQPGYGSQRAGYGTPQPRRTGTPLPLSRQRYQVLRRRRLMALAGLAALAVVLVIAVVLILKPRGGRDVTVAANPTLEATVEPELTAEPAEATAEPAVTAVPGNRSARIRVVGDIMMCAGNLAYAKRHDYDFHDQFSMVKKLLKDADYTMGNMEGTVGKYNKSAYSGYPQFNCPETILETLKDDGFDFLTLANNHMLDRWSGGVKNTVDWVEKYKLAHVGAYRTKKEKNKPVIEEVNGIKIGFLAYTHSTNTMEKRGTDQSAVDLVPYIQKANFKNDVKKLREAGAEVVIAWPHWGAEYVRTPDDSQKKYARQLAEAGVDIILGSHSHMVQPMGFQTVTDTDGKKKKVFTIFSLGNFISDHTKQYCDNGVILDLTIVENANGKFTVENVGYIPTYTWKQGGGIRVIPSGKYLSKRPKGMDDENYQRLRISYDEIVQVLGNDFRIISG